VRVGCLRRVLHVLQNSTPKDPSGDPPVWARAGGDGPTWERRGAQLGMICSFGFRVSGFGFRVSGFGFRGRVSGFGLGFRFRVSGFGLGAFFRVG